MPTLLLLGGCHWLLPYSAQDSHLDSATKDLRTESAVADATAERLPDSRVRDRGGEGPIVGTPRWARVYTALLSKGAEGHAVALSSTRIYLGGTFSGDLTLGTKLTAAGNSDGFAARFLPDGALEQANAIGSSAADGLQGLAVSSGPVYTQDQIWAGGAMGAPFNAASSTYDPGLSLFRLDASLMIVEVASISGGLPGGLPGNQAGVWGLDFKGGLVRLAGTFYGTLQLGSSTVSTGSLSDGGIIMASWNPQGGPWSFHQPNTPNLDEGRAIAGDAGHMYVTGASNGQIVVHGLLTGGAPAFERPLGKGRGLAIAHDGAKLYVAGTFTGPTTIGSSTLPGFAGSVDILVAELNTDSTPVRAVAFGGSSYDEARALAVRDGRLYVAGTLGKGGSVGSQGATKMESFVACLDTATLAVRWSTVYSGSGGLERANALAVNDQQVVVAGAVSGNGALFGTPFNITASSGVYLLSLQP